MKLEILEISVKVSKRPEFLCSEVLGSCYPIYRLRVSIGKRSAEVSGWLHCRWNKGPSGSRGWSCSSSDGYSSGIPRVESEGTHIELYHPSIYSAPVASFYVPFETTEIEPIRRDVELQIRDSIPSLSEPDPEEIWESLKYSNLLKSGDRVRYGNAEGAGMCLAWKLQDGSFSCRWWPDEKDVGHILDRYGVI